MTARFGFGLLLAVVTTLGGLLPGAVAAEREVYFAETGHYVRGAFLDFFEGHGGLAIFGYPRTDEVVEGGRTVQYFQRGRFEYWPENPDAYKVQLMLIGDTVLGPGDPAIPADEIPAPGDPARRHFPETGHTISSAFLDFFDKNGGLAIFGYPTTELKTVDGVLTQNFQRARFEWHAENPDPHKVQLGLLGDDYIFKMGKVALSLTRPAAGQAIVPASTQGKLAIMLGVGADIMVLNADGSGLRRLTSGIDPAWSPDGRKLAVTRLEDPRGVYVIDGETGVEALAYGIDQARLPTWSPDATRIAFQNGFIDYFAVRGPGGRMMFVPDQRYRIWTVNLTDGTGFGLPSDLHSFSPAWAPDGKSILFKGDKALYMTDMQNGMRPVPGTDNRFLSPAWSPDGKKVAVVWKQHDHTEIAVINWDGTGFQNLTNTQVYGQQASNNVSPAWSPDGTKMAFVTDREGDWKVYVMNADGSDQKRLLDLPIDYQSASERIVSWGR